VVVGTTEILRKGTNIPLLKNMTKEKFAEMFSGKTPILAVILRQIPGARDIFMTIMEVISLQTNDNIIPEKEEPHQENP
jgi:hypothetical protein